MREPVGDSSGAQIYLAIEGMHCLERCVPAVESALSQLKGVASVHVDLATQEAMVTMEQNELPESSAFEAAVAAQGFLATVTKGAGILPPRLSQSSVLRIEGMTCMSCVNTVSKQLSSTMGVQAFSVDLTVGEASVVFDPVLVDLATLVEQVEDVGFAASLASESDKKGVLFRVEGMTCGACVKTITNHLQAQPFVSSAQV
jgi:Cu+-exporting ATPase